MIDSTGPDDADDADDATLRDAEESSGRRVVGRSLGPYTLLEELGHGSFGAVYRARKEGAEGEFAVKVLTAPDAESILRFHIEAVVSSKLDHPGIIPLEDAGRQGAGYYVVMSYCRGETLQQRLRRPLNGGEAVALVAEVARAADYAHEQGVIHRDLKPANVILEEETGRPRITDFGLARDEALFSLTRTGDTLGTPAYMSPEQLRGEKGIDRRSDVYALGVMLYECLSGRRPFHASTFVDLCHAVRLGNPTPLRKLAPRVPVELEGICMRALSYDPSNRYPTAGLLAADLEAFLGGEPTSPAQEPLPASSRTRSLWQRPGAVVGGSAAVGVLLVVVAGALSFRSVGPAQKTVDAPSPHERDAPAPPQKTSQPLADLGLFSTPRPPVSNARRPAPLRDDQPLEGRGWVLRCGMSAEQLTTRMKEYRSRCPTVLYANCDGAQPRFLAVWTDDPRRWSFQLGMTKAKFEKVSETFAVRRLMPRCVAAYSTPQGTRLAAIWAEEPVGQARRVGSLITSLEYQRQFVASRRQRIWPAWHSGLGSGEARRLNLVWATGRVPNMGVHDRPARNFRHTLVGVQGKYTLYCATRYGTPAQPLYGALWAQDGRDTLLFHDQPAVSVPATARLLAGEGYRPLFVMEAGVRGRDLRLTSSWVRDRGGRSWRVTGDGAAGLGTLDGIVREFMTRRGVTRGALAVTQGKRLTLARGYTHAASGVSATSPFARFRIGALSKALTALAVLDLVERGRLKLGQTLATLLPDFVRRVRPADAGRVGRVTLAHLLAQTAGWQTLRRTVGPRRYDFPVFRSMVLRLEHEPDLVIGSKLKRRLPVTAAMLLDYIAGVGLPREPGRTFVPSDVCFLLLGQVIEAVTKKAYAEHMQLRLLTPLEARGIALGRTPSAARLPGEVFYEGSRACFDTLGSRAIVPRPYGARNLQRMEAADAWVASAPDLARVVSALSDPRSSPLLSLATIETMWTARQGDSALGWHVSGSPSDPRAWQTSRLAGTFAHMERLPGGLGLVLLLNKAVDGRKLVEELRRDLVRRVSSATPPPK